MPKARGRETDLQGGSSSLFENGSLEAWTGALYFETPLVKEVLVTQLVAAGVPESHANYMAGHVTDTYNQVQSLGVEKLRQVYSKAGLSIRPRVQQTAYEILAALAKQMGKDPEKVLVKESFLEPHRTVISHDDNEREYARIILAKLRELASS